LQSVAISDSGHIVGTFSSGQNIDLVALKLSHFYGANYLKVFDRSAFAATELSSIAITGAAG
jgi:flagellar hook protein FlgE